MIKPGDVISYLDMCREEGVNLQRGMNFKLGGKHSVILMSLRTGAPYADGVEILAKMPGCEVVVTCPRYWYQLSS